MAWKSERKRSVTFRKRRLRGDPFGWSLQPLMASGPRAMACMALILPLPRNSGLDLVHNWILLVSTEVAARSHQKMLDGTRQRSRSRFDDDDE